MKHAATYRLFFFILSMLISLAQIFSQEYFNCSDEVWMLEQDSERLVRFRINPSNNAIQINEFITDVQGRVDAIAFNHKEGLLYGINESTHELYSIDANGTFELITQLDIDPLLKYKVLVFDLNADRLITVGSLNELDRSIEFIDLNNSFDVQRINLNGNLYISDYAMDPGTGILYGYNQLDETVVFFDIDQLEFGSITVAQPGNAYQGLYFNPFGELLAFGSTAFGVSSALFRINAPGEVETRLSTGPESYMRDFAHCSYRVDMTLSVDPKFSFPCNEVEFECRIANSTGAQLQALDYFLELPFGFSIIDLEGDDLNGQLDIDNNRLFLNDFDLETEVIKLSILAEVPDLDAGVYDSRSTIAGLPVFYGQSLLSDNPATIRQDDPTQFEIRRMDEDSLFISLFYCRDDPAILDGLEFGTDLRWWDGSAVGSRTVEASGIYELEVLSGCSSFVVIFDVTIASCPFNIELNHTIEPDTIFPCSEVELNFIIENDTGNEYNGIEFSNQLPDYFEFVSVIKNPYGGQIVEPDSDNLLMINDMFVYDGIDTLSFLVRVGDIEPGRYGNRATISNFPSNLGSIRISDFPGTPALDSTNLVVQGVISDTSYIEKFLCKSSSLVLDGSSFGFDFEWEDGSTDSQLEVNRLGSYELNVFSGCDVSYVFFNVLPADEIDLSISQNQYEIILGDSLLLEPGVISENGVINFQWSDSQDTTMSCMDCLSPYVRPFFDNSYRLRVDNGLCLDSLEIIVNVDKTRRIYAPNIFAPETFGENAYYYLQSPDYAVIEELTIVNRWGNIVYQAQEYDINDIEYRWDGYTSDGNAPAGVYYWKARIRFLDGITEDFVGSLSLVR
jgi:hypothetical protein